MYHKKLPEAEMLGLFKLPSNKILSIHFLLQHFPMPVTQSQIDHLWKISQTHSWPRGIYQEVGGDSSGVREV